MPRDVVDQIFTALETIEKHVTQLDPGGCHWDLRITCAYRIFRAFDIPRFRLEPVDPQQVRVDLLAVIEYIEQFPRANNGSQMLRSNQVSHESPQSEAQRMQFLYGLAWSQLTQDQYLDAAGLFASRLRNSNIDVSFLKGAKCLDLGTGIARYALAMIQLGARHVVGVDFSLQCLEEARRRLGGSEEGKHITLIHNDLYKLPKDMDQTFDFVCTNGVIHHLPDPVKGLEVMFRCLTKGGKAFVFVFSHSDGPWWPSVELMRQLAAPVPIEYAHRILKFYEVQGTKIFNMLDYSYTPIQHKFNCKWFEEKLYNVGFRDVQLLEGGVIHDSILRSKLFDTDRKVYGVIETRYLLAK